MPFNFLLRYSVEAGAHSCGEEGKGIALEKREGETFLIFHLDNEIVRKKFQLQESACCDNLTYYKFDQDTPFLLFVEHKGKYDIDHAADQILNAFKAICPAQSPFRTLAKGLIVSSGGAPKNRKDLEKKLAKEGIFLYFGTSKKNRYKNLREIEVLKKFFAPSK